MYQDKVVEQQKLVLNETHYTAGEIVLDIIIGVLDGLIIPFILAAFLLGANFSLSIVLITSIGQIAARAVYVSVAAQLDAELLAQYAIDPRKYGPLVNALRKKPQAWLVSMMMSELGLEKPNPKRVLQSAFTIVVASILGGLVPLIPYMFIQVAAKAMVASVIVTLLGLLLFGYAKGYLTGNKPFKSALQMALIGAIAFAAALGVGKAVQLFLLHKGVSRDVNSGVVY